MDECNFCTLRGNFSKCVELPCSHRETWIFREAVKMAYMAGKLGVKSLSSLDYFHDTYGKQSDSNKGEPK